MIRHEIVLYKDYSAFRPVITSPPRRLRTSFVNFVDARMPIISLKNKSVLGTRPIPMIKQRQQTLWISTPYT